MSIETIYDASDEKHVKTKKTRAKIEREGKREIGLWVLAEIMAADPNAYARLMTKHQEEITTNG